jgi:nickel/cobalt exporter
MTAFADLIQHGSGWLFIPSAILLGALHGLEPGHSKTLMAAFIVAIRGTVFQAVLLGLAATASHTAVVWAIALGGLYIGQGFNAETAEPYFQLVSAMMIIGVAGWMLWQVVGEQARARAAGIPHDHDHEHERHEHDHDHGHAVTHGDVRRIDTGHGFADLQLFEENGPGRWRIRVGKGARWPAEDVQLETERPDGKRQCFSFVARDGYLESAEDVPEPHDFMVRLRLGHAGHFHNFDVPFLAQPCGHDHIHEELRGLEVATSGYQDAHELAHANDIRRRFAGRNVTTGQIVLFGLTGGLIPCPAAVTVLLLCLQLKEIPLGAALVLCFSIGLAVTLVGVGVTAALSVKHISGRWPWFQTIARRAPYFSSVLIMAVGVYVGVQGFLALH